MRWIWDEAKNRANQAKHGLGFELAQLVFNDPMRAERLDPHPAEERWQIIGDVAGRVIIVVHTGPDGEDIENGIGRIISARKATKQERRAYEEGEF